MKIVPFRAGHVASFDDMSAVVCMLDSVSIPKLTAHRRMEDNPIDSPTL